MDLERIGQLVSEDISRKAGPRACPWCGDSGTLFEEIDEERWPVAVPCWNCRVYCGACKRDVPKKRHVCNAAGDLQ
jgi:hypothetical protein